MKSCRNHLPPLESHFYSSSIFTPPTTASSSPHALSARLTPLQVFFSRILPVLSSPRLASPSSSFLLCLAFSLSCPTPLLHQAFFKQLVLGSAPTSNIHSKGAETSHVWVKMKKRKKQKTNPTPSTYLPSAPSLPPSLLPPLSICFPPSSPSYVPPHPKCCLFIIAEVF